MSIAITDAHTALAQTVASFVLRREMRREARELLEADEAALPGWWPEVADLGWLGIHVREEHGGSGYGFEELVVVVEQLGRSIAPGPFVPTVVASAVLGVASNDVGVKAVLPRLVDGSATAGIALDASLDVRHGRAYGRAPAVLCGDHADMLLLPFDDDVVLVEVAAGGVVTNVPANLDPTRRIASIALEDAPATVLTGAQRLLVDFARIVMAAEAVGIARECTELAAAYAKARHQFGRPIGMFQAVKHHCADMLVATELATAAVWDAARAASTGGEQLTYAAAVAAALAPPAADLCANLNIQVHGGIGFTWEHDAHLYLRRATVLRALANPDGAAREVTDLVRRGVRRVASVDLPPEAELLRESVRAFAERVRGTDEAAQREAMIEHGYVMPHWPTPWGRAANAVEQLVIEQEFESAGVRRPSYGITGWVILTLIQHGTDEQVQRWVPPALRQEVIWCQLFSEPDAGSDAAGITTAARRVHGGWRLTGQKVWTSGAHVASLGFATVRTNPDAAKHQGITTMVIDMQSPGVDVRPLRMITGGAEFNEVFLDEVFVPDSDVVGPIDQGWTVARATLANESVSIGGGESGVTVNGEEMLAVHDAHPERVAGGTPRIGHYIATQRAAALLNHRRSARAVSGSSAGPEGSITKLVLSELAHESAAILAEAHGAEMAFAEGPAELAAFLVLMHRGMSIAGGTSEIKRNQIGERCLGLPRDPLLSR